MFMLHLPLSHYYRVLKEVSGGITASTFTIAAEERSGTFWDATVIVRAPKFQHVVLSTEMILCKLSELQKWTAAELLGDGAGMHHKLRYTLFTLLSVQEER